MASSLDISSTSQQVRVCIAHRGKHESDEPRRFASRGIRVERIVVHSPGGYDYDWSGGAHYLSVHDLQLVDGETHSDFSSPSYRHDLRGTLTFVPAGARIWGWSIPRASNQCFTALYLEPSTLEEELAQRLRSVGSRGRVYFSDLALKRTFEKIKTVLTGNGTYDAMYLESLCLVAGLELVMAQSSDQILTRQPYGCLSRATEQKLLQFIDANLGGEITLADLAAVAGLSRFHFIRVFRQSFSQTPYQFVLNRRIERALSLLKNGRASLQQIASAVGFNDPARFSRAFRRITGASPRNPR